MNNYFSLPNSVIVVPKERHCGKMYSKRLKEQVRKIFNAIADMGEGPHAG